MAQRRLPGPLGVLEQMSQQGASAERLKAYVEALNQQPSASLSVLVQVQDLEEAYPSWKDACETLDIPKRPQGSPQGSARPQQGTGQLRCREFWGPPAKRGSSAVPVCFAEVEHSMMRTPLAAILKQGRGHIVSKLLCVVERLYDGTDGRYGAILRDRTGSMRALLEPHSLEQHRALDAGATVSLDQVPVTFGADGCAYLHVWTNSIKHIWPAPPVLTGTGTTQATPRAPQPTPRQNIPAQGPSVQPAAAVRRPGTTGTLTGPSPPLSPGLLTWPGTDPRDAPTTGPLPGSHMQRQQQQGGGLGGAIPRDGAGTEAYRQQQQLIGAPAARPVQPPQPARPHAQGETPHIGMGLRQHGLQTVPGDQRGLLQPPQHQPAPAAAAAGAAAGARLGERLGSAGPRVPEPQAGLRDAIGTDVVQGRVGAVNVHGTRPEVNGLMGQPIGQPVSHNQHQQSGGGMRPIPRLDQPHSGQPDSVRGPGPMQGPASGLMQGVAAMGTHGPASGSAQQGAGPHRDARASAGVSQLGLAGAIFGPALARPQGGTTPQGPQGHADMATRMVPPAANTNRTPSAQLQDTQPPLTLTQVSPSPLGTLQTPGSDQGRMYQGVGAGVGPKGPPPHALAPAGAPGAGRGGADQSARVGHGGSSLGQSGPSPAATPHRPPWASSPAGLQPPSNREPITAGLESAGSTQLNGETPANAHHMHAHGGRGRAGAPCGAGLDSRGSTQFGSAPPSAAAAPAHERLHGMTGAHVGAGGRMGTHAHQNSNGGESRGSTQFPSGPPNTNQHAAVAPRDPLSGARRGSTQFEQSQMLLGGESASEDEGDDLPQFNVLGVGSQRQRGRTESGTGPVSNSAGPTPRQGAHDTDPATKRPRTTSHNPPPAQPAVMGQQGRQRAVTLPGAGTDAARRTPPPAQGAMPPPPPRPTSLLSPLQRTQTPGAAGGVGALRPSPPPVPTMQQQQQLPHQRSMQQQQQLRPQQAQPQQLFMQQQLRPQQAGQGPVQPAPGTMHTGQPGHQPGMLGAPRLGLTNLPEQPSAAPAAHKPIQPGMQASNTHQLQVPPRQPLQPFAANRPAAPPAQPGQPAQPQPHKQHGEPWQPFGRGPAGVAGAAAAASTGPAGVFHAAGGGGVGASGVVKRVSGRASDWAQQNILDSDDENVMLDDD